ncbi:MAG: hypothetical protein JO029_08720 [Candidatus Eremiobacteraeota bacterium]|nr:hypothetical protein [Candidatus Eremiobacteraeota bacterium]MBV8582532.1 hypothetical protein [Candidatus Eremiobacteraeota bacterium]MBV8654622.1 hypothetical protein [Candidatus Eremiobacteraeota bacterium]
MDPSRRFATVVLAAGAVVLLLAIALGQRMGDRVLGQATEHALPAVAAEITPEPYASSGPYGPDWKRSETLSAAADPRFPDPRIPPQPLPTPPPATPKPSASATPTINPNLPIWRQKPLPTATPIPTEVPTEEPSASPSPPSR